MTVARGKIYNPEVASQLHDFSQLRWRNITPTDIDLGLDMALIRLLVIGEIKYVSAPKPTGQRRFMERLLRHARMAGWSALGFYAVHRISPPHEIPVHDCWITEVSWDGKVWREPRRRVNVKKAIDMAMEMARKAGQVRVGDVMIKVR
jgi:hypothetical protein